MGCQVYYFSGSYSQSLKRSMNVDQLFSMYHEPKLVIDTIMYKREHPEYTAKIMLDSGAFTHYQESKKKGIILTDKDMYEYTDKYIEYLNEWGEDLECFVGVDSVPDPTNVDPTFIQKTWDNYMYMWERLKPSIRHKLIPVFHYGEDFEWLKKFLDYRHPDGSKIEYMGLAISLEGTRSVRINWGQKAMKIIRESTNPNVKTHAFGVGVKSVLEYIDVYSTDATSYLKRAAYGMISIDDKTIYVSDMQKENCKGNHYTDKSVAYQYDVEKIIEERGFRVSPAEGTYDHVDAQHCVATVEGNTYKVELAAVGLAITIDGVDYKLDEEFDNPDNVFCGTWVESNPVDPVLPQKFTFNNDGTCLYDNGKCLATNPYARGKFNIDDTLRWMKELRGQKIEKLVSKVDLGW